MLSGMKPLPKAIIIALPIIIAIGLYMKFAPEKKVEVVPMTPVVVEQVSVEPIITVAPPQSALPQEDSSQSAGMKALLEKGKK